MPTISRDRRVAFIHVPKTAGTTVAMFFQQHGLVEPLDWDRWYRRNDHKSARFVREQIDRNGALGELRWADLFSFAVVRNPFDRMISLWHYKRRMPEQRFHTEATSMPFAEFAVCCLAPGARDELFADQLSWLEGDPGEIIVDRVVRLDTLEAEWPALCREAGLPDAPLGQVNRTHGPDYDHDTYYDSAARTAVEEVFARDLDTFDFDYVPRRAARNRVRSSVVQFCPTLGSYCGIATYTEMLCEATGHVSVRDLDEIDFDAISVLHLQHEFDIFPDGLLEDAIARCEAHGVRLFVTMHRVERVSLRVLAQHYYFIFRRRMRARAARRAPATPSVPAAAPVAVPPRRQGLRWAVSRTLRVAREFVRRALHQKRILDASERVVVHSEDARRELLRWGRGDVSVLSHPLKPFPTADRLRSEEDGKLHVGYFGFLSAEKDIHRLVEACERIPDVRLHLLACIPQHAGGIATAPDELVGWLRSFDWIDLDQRFLPLEQIVHELSSNDVNVYLTSTPRLGYSTSGSIRQYLAAQRPIVANRSVMTDDLAGIVTLLPDTRLETIAAQLQGFDPDVGPIAEYSRSHTWERMPDLYDAPVDDPVSRSA